MPNKSYVYFENVEPSNLVFLETYNTAFDEIITRFTDQNRRTSEIEDKVNLTFLISKYKWYIILQKQEEKNKLKDMDFCY